MLHTSVPHIADLHRLRGPEAADESSVDLLFEIPHGATETSDFTELAALIQSPLPKNLIDFFYVNTDVGAFELAIASARELLKIHPHWTIDVLRSRIPRTFIDCNRRIDSAPEAFKEGGVTPGLMPWIQAPEDLALLHERYNAYLDMVHSATAQLTPNGSTVLLHTFSPRTVGVEVDEKIVENLHRAYEPEIFQTWPLRPEFEIIDRDADGIEHTPAHLKKAFRKELASAGWNLEESSTYPLHPSTIAHQHAIDRPGRVLCIEVRRDLLANPFDPFAEMFIAPEKVDAVAAPFSRALAQWGNP